MKPQMKSMGLSLMVLAVLATGTVACSKSDSKKTDDEAKPKAAGKEIPEDKLKNSTTSEVVEIAEGRYAVYPPAVEMNGIDIANEPVKGTCKEISKLKNEIKRLEDEKAKYVEIVEVDNSAEQGVDELATEIEIKTTKLTELSSKTADTHPSYKKDKFFANFDALKAANPEMSFEMAEPKSAIVTLENSNRKASATSSVDLSKAKMRGTFASQDRAVKMTLPLSFEIICAYKEVKNAKDQTQKMILTLK